MEREMTGTGWHQQAKRWRLRISLADAVAAKLDREAERLGITPAALAALIVGQHFADKEGK